MNRLNFRKILSFKKIILASLIGLNSHSSIAQNFTGPFDLDIRRWGNSPGPSLTISDSAGTNIVYVWRVDRGRYLTPTTFFDNSTLHECDRPRVRVTMTNRAQTFGDPGTNELFGRGRGNCGSALVQ